MNREAFLAQLSSAGYDEIVTATRDPDGVMDLHAHPFEARALILSGELTIRIGDDAHTYRTGDIFHLAPNTEHSETYGPDGVSYLVGRR
ncbi:cupin domain-containing protein [Caballeronia sp. LZ035]|uniref:cupin domain-containing protein n=1 Tax=Caballeronia sp. LZ035 TaxID=3038568 RepID=UPI002858EE7B|nr:cupin domain-containing protein [Caballeronia sp. LZ035]MDR5755369.1 cupin domain-containing protein [Caballeronia sp. LZ035]